MEVLETGIYTSQKNNFKIGFPLTWSIGLGNYQQEVYSSPFPPAIRTMSLIKEDFLRRSSKTKSSQFSCFHRLQVHDELLLLHQFKVSFIEEPAFTYIGDAVIIDEIGSSSAIPFRIALPHIAISNYSTKLKV